jgi:hypothetical protein
MVFAFIVGVVVIVALFLALVLDSPKTSYIKSPVNSEDSSPKEPVLSFEFYDPFDYSFNPYPYRFPMDDLDSANSMLISSPFYRGSIFNNWGYDD